MPISNSQATELQVFGTGLAVSNVAFAPNGGSSPVASTLKGAFTSTVTRTGAGAYLVTLTGFSPKAFVGGSAHVLDAANPTDSVARIGAVVITPSTKTVTLVVLTSTAPGIQKDIAAAATSLVKLVLYWKLFSGVDSSGL